MGILCITLKKLFVGVVVCVVLCTIGMNLCVCSCMQRRNERGKIHGRQITMGWRRMAARVPKSLNNVTSTFSNSADLLLKDFKFDHGGAKPGSCPGRHLTLVMPLLVCILYLHWVIISSLSNNGMNHSSSSLVNFTNILTSYFGTFACVDIETLKIHFAHLLCSCVWWKSSQSYSQCRET